ncbi:hypothetical protein PHMEG_00019866 [Phytophthora megakarya]|uniref:Uncharacterized protein n=1 Tax=Phytophthora megakarya TaxID=4795 RepID=A0A225VRS9_9STRA|nr:hypothetical protein PHMEG_00019866 [Phytophthora megakarya]
MNKNKRKEFVEKLDEHVAKGDMITYQDETDFNLGGHASVSKLSSNSHLCRVKPAYSRWRFNIDGRRAPANT